MDLKNRLYLTISAAVFGCIIIIFVSLSGINLITKLNTTYLSGVQAISDLRKLSMLTSELQISGNQEYSILRWKESIEIFKIQFDQFINSKYLKRIVNNPSLKNKYSSVVVYSNISFQRINLLIEELDKAISEKPFNNMGFYLQSFFLKSHKFSNLSRMVDDVNTYLTASFEIPLFHLINSVKKEIESLKLRIIIVLVLLIIFVIFIIIIFFVGFSNHMRKINIDLKKMVNKRTAELLKTNFALENTINSLQTAQKQLVESAKMAALGKLVAGISHEINTPIGVAITASSHLENCVNKIDSASNVIEFGSINSNKFLYDIKELSGLIYRNLKRASELITSFKQVAVDQTSEEKRDFNFKKLIDEILISLKQKISKNKHTVEVKCPKNLVINNYPGEIFQIFSNLIMNSILHGFHEKQNGIIKIIVKKASGNINITFSDNGKGMNKTVQAKIFDPFFTTAKNIGGTGLGMHIVYNIVTQKLKGTIKCSSSIKKGAKFLIIFPA